VYETLSVTTERDTLKIGNTVVLPVAANTFVNRQSPGDRYEFIKDREGRVQKLVMTIEAPKVYEKMEEAEHISNRRNGFTRADTLRGMLSPPRSCYDVLFYDLNVTVAPETKSISGHTVIRFRAVESFDKMQVDLYANMKIEKILYHGGELAYTREFNAVFLQFPAPIGRNQVEEVDIYYGGKPRLPDIDALAGGFFWYQNKNGRLWIQSVCQGAGASLWWPCKDHLSDKPDSMKISITVPQGLTDISNGRLLARTELPDHQTRFDWYVSYPINNYNVAINIGEYAHYSDQYIRQKDTLSLDYYYMPYNLDHAWQLFRHVKPMLELYEKDFGPYPFERDGFKLMESLYPMEHQSAVCIGPINNPVSSDKVDTADLRRMIWHESAHEWWGNSVTCRDIADLWIHESFAVYAEALNYEKVSPEAALRHIKEESPRNDEPIIGVYDVNNFHLGDMYTKGTRMLQMLRTIIGNDSLWFDILRGIQKDFRYQSVTTKTIMDYFSERTKKDYTYFFDQYLRYTTIPELQLAFKKQGSALLVTYRWKADVEGFRMPVRVTLAKNQFSFIYPVTSPQTMLLPTMQAKDFKVDTGTFYIGVKKE
jgi:aminopeptidase N